MTDVKLGYRHAAPRLEPEPEDFRRQENLHQVRALLALEGSPSRFSFFRPRRTFRTRLRPLHVSRDDFRPCRRRVQWRARARRAFAGRPVAHPLGVFGGHGDSGRGKCVHGAQPRHRFAVADPALAELAADHTFADPRHVDVVQPDVRPGQGNPVLVADAARADRHVRGATGNRRGVPRLAGGLGQARGGRGLGTSIGARRHRPFLGSAGQCRMDRGQLRTHVPGLGGHDAVADQVHALGRRHPVCRPHLYQQPDPAFPRRRLIPRGHQFRSPVRIRPADAPFVPPGRTLRTRGLSFAEGAAELADGADRRRIPADRRRAGEGGHPFRRRQRLRREGLPGPRIAGRADDRAAVRPRPARIAAVRQSKFSPFAV